VNHAALLQRLQFRPRDDFKRLYRAFQNRPAFLAPATLEPCYAVARQKPEAFRNHRPVLAISFGGATTSAMLAEIRDGVPVVHHLTERRNPAVPVSLGTYLEEVLLSQPPFFNYLTHDPDPQIGISVAVLVSNGVPHHPSKLPTIEGLVARDLAAQAQTHHLGRNLARWLAQRGLKPAHVIYEADGPVAHLGGVGLSDIGTDERSVLMVCGNGMACADYRRFIVCGMYQCLCDIDPVLYPAEETEGGQYQYLVAGKGIYKILRRAAALQELDVAALFASDHDSEKVFHLWSDPRHAALDDVRSALDAAAFAELTELARAIVPRGIAVLANSILCSILLNGPAPGGTPFRLFLEGSIGTNPYVMDEMVQTFAHLVHDAALWVELGVAPPLMPVIARDLAAPVPAPGLGPCTLAAADLTLIGALFLAASSTALSRPCQT